MFRQMDDIPDIDAMFNSMNMNTPLRGKPDDHKPQRPGAWTRRRPSQRNDLDDLYAHQVPLHDMWDRRFYGGPPAGLNRFEELDDFDVPRSMSADGMNYRDAHTSRPPNRHDYRERRITFEQAAAAMYAALVCANQECQGIEKTFSDQISRLTRWLPPQYVDSLWAIRINWNGVPANEYSRNPDLKPHPDTVTYESIVKRFSTAMAEIKASAPPDRMALGDNQHGLSLGWEILRTTMRKLQISLEAIEELLHMVRTQRARMPLLLHEIKAAMQSLESVRDVWDGPRMPTPGTTPGTTPSTSSRKPDMRTPTSSMGPDRRTGYEGFPGFDDETTIDI